MWETRTYYHSCSLCECQKQGLTQTRQSKWHWWTQCPFLDAHASFSEANKNIHQEKEKNENDSSTQSQVNQLQHISFLPVFFIHLPGERSMITMIHPHNIASTFTTTGFHCNNFYHLFGFMDIWPKPTQQMDIHDDESMEIVDDEPKMDYFWESILELKDFCESIQESMNWELILESMDSERNFKPMDWDKESLS